MFFKMSIYARSGRLGPQTVKPQTAGPTLWPDRLIVKHRANTAGRDFVCGDLHGCFDTVEHALKQLDYDPLRDRLFSVGDLIDLVRRDADGHFVPQRAQRPGLGPAQPVERVQVFEPQGEVDVLTLVPQRDPRATVSTSD